MARISRCSTMRPQVPDLQLDIESKLFAPIAFGSGYGGDSSWAHGTWKGGPVAERAPTT